MDIFGILTLFGGLAMFLFGMDVMGKGLEKRAGGKLHEILETLTASPARGFLLGLAVTAIIQSSSATTVMVVGFVNSGIMKLGQASGIIMGANVGTTVTSWILSLTGLQGDSLFIKLLKPSSFSPVLGMVGIILYMGKDSRRRDIGSILLGFAVLMFGMQTISGAVEPLAGVPEFTRLFVLFENPLLGVLTGALLTAVIQSSSASVGILQALSVTGAITYASAVPIILGQNIGTCVTALIASVGTNKGARRAAFVHLYFNLIGVAVFLALFLVANAIFHPLIVAEAATGVGIAIVHTAFNLMATALLLPFTKFLEKLAYLTIPDDAKGDEIALLDERLMQTPALAVAQSYTQTVAMSHLARRAVLDAMRLCVNFDPKGASDVAEAETKIDRYEDALGAYLVHLSSHEMTDADSRTVSMLLHTIGDLERLGDHALNISQTAAEIHDKGIGFSPEAQAETSTLARAVHEVLDISVNALETGDVDQATWVEPLEQVVDELTQSIRSHHIERLQAGACTIEMGFVLSDILTNYERVADHCSNIAIAVIESARDRFDAHEYAERIAESPDFRIHYEEYARRYRLPEPEAIPARAPEKG